MTFQPAAGIPEEKVPALLARAAELDRQFISVEALRTAALEAGISGAAVDQAIAEFEAGIDRGVLRRDVVEETTAPRWRRWLRKAWPALQLSALAILLGVFGGSDDGLIVVSLLASLGITIMLARREHDHDAADFQLSMTVLTIGMAIGFQGANGDSEGVIVLTIAGILQFLFGTLFIVTRKRADAPSVEINAS